ncbi:NAD-dependent epimerase/dehydratase family protein, partial [Salinivibrio sp. MA427]
MKILITGGTGLIGQALIPRLLSEHQVTVLS